jgi:hypothetical protein
MIRYYWFKLTLLFRPKERRRLKEQYRVYFSKKLLEHQIDKLELYHPEYRAEIPRNPETLKRIFPK